MADKKNKRDKSSESNTNEADKSRRRNRALAVVTIILGIAIVAVIAVICVIYSGFVGDAKKLAKRAANIYAFGDGENMTSLIAPGYIEYFDGKSEMLSVSDIQSLYVTNFRTYVKAKIGEIDDIECRITDIMAVSNIDELTQQFADNGVQGVSEYRSVDADWVVTGEDGGEVTVQVKVFVLKCDDGWFVDYVLLPEEISGLSTADGEEIGDDTTAN